MNSILTEFSLDNKVAIVTDALSQFLDDTGTAKMIGLTPLKALGKPDDCVVFSF